MNSQILNQCSSGRRRRAGCWSIYPFLLFLTSLVLLSEGEEKVVTKTGTDMGVLRGHHKRIFQIVRVKTRRSSIFQWVFFKFTFVIIEQVYFFPLFLSFFKCILAHFKKGAAGPSNSVQIKGGWTATLFKECQSCDNVGRWLRRRVIHVIF